MEEVGHRVVRSWRLIEGSESRGGLIEQTHSLTTLCFLRAEATWLPASQLSTTLSLTDVLSSPGFWNDPVGL